MSRSTLALALVLVAVRAGAQTTPTQAVEVIREIRVHGNHTTPDRDVLAVAGLVIGAPASEDAIAEASKRLRDSGRFSSVELRKRFRSIVDPSDILVIVLVDERPGISDSDLTPGPMKRLRFAGMWLPVLDYADGYGFTYGPTQPHFRAAHVGRGAAGGGGSRATLRARAVHESGWNTVTDTA